MLKEQDVIARALAAIDRTMEKLEETPDLFRAMVDDHAWIADQIGDAIRAEFTMIEDFKVETVGGRFGIRDHATGALYGCLAKGGSTRAITFGKHEAAERRAYELNSERHAETRGTAK